MADISKLNIAISGNSAELDKTVDKAEKTLNKLGGSGSDMFKRPRESLAAIERSLDGRLKPKLQKLKDEFNQSLVGSGFMAGGTASQINGLKAKLTKDGQAAGKAAGAGAAGTFRTELAKKLAERTGLGSVLGEKGVSSFAVGAGLIGGLSLIGNAAADQKQRNRESGITPRLLGSEALGNTVEAVQNLPGVKQVSEGLGEALALTGLDQKILGQSTSLSDANAELEQLKKNAALYEQYRVGAAEASKQTAINDKQSALAIQNLQSARNQTFLGGREARTESVRNDARNRIAGIVADRDANNKTINENIANASKDLAKTNDAAAITGIKDYIKTQEQARAKNNAAAKEQANIIAATADEQIGVINRTLPDLAKQTEMYESLGDTIDTLASDEFEGLRKAFELTKPDPSALANYNKRIDEYKSKLGDIAVENESKSANAQLKVATANQDDPVAMLRAQIDARDDLNQKQKDELFYVQKILLAQQQLNAFRREMQNIDAQIAIARAGSDPIARIRAEIAARKDLNDQQKRELEQKRTEELLATEGNELRESVKNPREKLKDEIEKIRRNVLGGSVDDETARRAIENARNNFMDANKVSNPALMQSGSGSAQRLAYVSAGRAQDSNNPMVREQKKTNDLLADIKNGRTSGEVAGGII